MPQKILSRTIWDREGQSVWGPSPGLCLVTSHLINGGEFLPPTAPTNHRLYAAEAAFGGVWAAETPQAHDMETPREHDTETPQAHDMETPQAQGGGEGSGGGDGACMRGRDVLGVWQPPQPLGRTGAAAGARAARPGT